MYDPDRYRDKAEIDRWKERDPITLLAARLVADGIADAARLADIDAEVVAEVDASVAFAEAGTDEGVETLHRYVTSEAGAS
jgi:pyruvate dehydrogenase E1 component alpha subunit